MRDETGKPHTGTTGAQKEVTCILWKSSQVTTQLHAKQLCREGEHQI